MYQQCTREDEDWDGHCNREVGPGSKLKEIHEMDRDRKRLLRNFTFLTAKEEKRLVFINLKAVSLLQRVCDRFGSGQGARPGPVRAIENDDLSQASRCRCETASKGEAVEVAPPPPPTRKCQPRFT
ncbi:hypothetical protein EVAR_76285_1 [Eumeta japonica]|uniref:Uncharacterized protein n=1 Tax=Eumeta variegata TaxID=151549 RepID=A0A4C1UPQ1_EUMVA|nr:hypothetical protein EVAR_76285_1 [Eumeta japonica]